MRYELAILSNNTTRDAGDTLIVELSSALRRVVSVDSVSVRQDIAPDANDYHDLEVRWSFDKMNWSAWSPYLTAGTLQPDPFPALVSEGRPFFLNLRVTRGAPSTGAARVLNRVRVDFTMGPAPEQPVASPFVEDGCRASACVSSNSCSGIVTACDPSLVWRPYDLMGPAIKTYEELACVSTEMWGHCVRYFRVAPDRDSGDAVLKEYSVYDAVDVKDILALVKDNAFPDNQFHYMPFDMEFQEGLEVTILRKHFETAFGAGKRPQEKDFLYFPLIDRLFEVHSAYLKRDFLQAQVSHSLMLYKYQERSNVMKDRADERIGEYVDDITVDIEELLRGQIDAQEAQVTKPLQYKTISVGGHDHVRSSIHSSLLIRELDVENNFTLVSKYHYDMATVPLGEPGVTYKHTLSSGPTAGFAMSAWINPARTSIFSTTPTITLSGAGSTGVNGTYVLGGTAYVNPVSGFYLTYNPFSSDWYVWSSGGFPQVQYRSQVTGPQLPQVGLSWIAAHFGPSPAPVTSATGSTTGAEDYSPLLVGQTAGAVGASVSLIYASQGGTVGVAGVSVSVGATEYRFDGVLGVASGWHGLVVNFMPEFSQIQVNIWRMKPASEKTTNLTLVYSRTLDYQASAIAGGHPLWAPGGSHSFTNLRVWSSPVEEEKQPLILNQYIVRDSHLSKLVDNAVPPLRVPRTYAR